MTTIQEELAKFRTNSLFSSDKIGLIRDALTKNLKAGINTELYKQIYEDAFQDIEKQAFDRGANEAFNSGYVHGFADSYQTKNLIVYDIRDNYGSGQFPKTKHDAFVFNEFSNKNKVLLDRRLFANVETVTGVSIYKDKLERYNIDIPSLMDNIVGENSLLTFVPTPISKIREYATSKFFDRNTKIPNLNLW